MKRLIGLAVVLSLNGCAGVQQFVNATAASAAVSLRAAEDQNIKMWKFAACGTPLSAAFRNPEIIPALRALCIPSGAEASPMLMFEPYR